MNDAHSPYQAPQSGMTTPPPEATPSVKTAIPQVFGIIHIVYACLGIIGSVIGVGVLVVMKAVAAQGGEEMKELDSFFAAYDKIAIYSYIDAGLKLILGVVLLIAGIGLLKKKLWAQKLSVTWAVVRIVVAIAMVVLTYGASLEFQQEMADFTEANAGQENQLGLQSSMQGVGSVIGVIFIAIYPVVSLVLLSKKSVRDSLS